MGLFFPPALLRLPEDLCPEGMITFPTENLMIQLRINSQISQLNQNF